jgi:hypothetical protein
MSRFKNSSCKIINLFTALSPLTSTHFHFVTVVQAADLNPQIKQIESEKSAKSVDGVLIHKLSPFDLHGNAASSLRFQSLYWS